MASGLAQQLFFVGAGTKIWQQQEPDVRQQADADCEMPQHP